MPREAMHWYIAQQALDAYSSVPFVLERNAYFLGAMAPDAGYFYLEGRGDTAFPERLHGKDGEDTWDPLRLALQRTKSDLHKSFLLGYMSHVITDAIFHPAVYYITGNYYDVDEAKRLTAVKNHRLLETKLDCWIRARYPQTSLPRYVKDLWKSVDELTAVSALLACEIFTTEQLVASFQSFGSSQYKFLSPLIGAFVRVSTGVSERMRDLDSLFAFGRSSGLEQFDQPFSYRQPITGELFQTVTWHQLIEQAVAEHQQYFPKFFQSLLQGTIFCEGEVGPSLNFGLPSVSIKQARYFAS
jgi:hypothetical protein